MILSIGSSGVAAGQPVGGEETHKVFAPLGLLDTGIDGVELWHDYGSFALYKVTDAAWRSLPAGVRTTATLADDKDRILIDGFEQAAAPEAVMDLNSAQGADSASGQTDSTISGPALQLVQFVGPIKDEWLAAVDAVGATPIQYIATNGYLLWADEFARAKLEKMVENGEFLQFSAPYPTVLKVGPNLAARENADDMVSVVIQMYRHDGRGASEAAVQSITAEQFSTWTPVLNFQNLYATIQVSLWNASYWTRSRARSLPVTSTAISPAPKARATYPGWKATVSAQILLTTLSWTSPTMGLATVRSIPAIPH